MGCGFGEKYGRFFWLLRSKPLEVGYCCMIAICDGGWSRWAAAAGESVCFCSCGRGDCGKSIVLSGMDNLIGFHICIATVTPRSNDIIFRS